MPKTGPSAEITLAIEPSARAVEAPRKPRRKQVVRPVQKKVEVPAPKPLALQLVALGLLVALTVFLGWLLSKDPGTIPAACLGAGLLLCAFCLLTWISSVLQLGIGPAQLLAVLRVVVGAIKESSGNKSDTKNATTRGQTRASGTAP
jgi:hypothetical protein